MNLDDCLNKAGFRSLFRTGAVSSSPARTSLLGAQSTLARFHPLVGKSWEEQHNLKCHQDYVPKHPLGKSKLISKCGMLSAAQETIEEENTVAVRENKSLQTSVTHTLTAWDPTEGGFSPVWWAGPSLPSFLCLVFVSRVLSDLQSRTSVRINA